MKTHTLLLAAALLAGTAACSNAPANDPAGAYERGLAALEEGQPRTARIEFMNAIKADPGNGKIRLAQAETYLLLGDGVAAEAEIARARQGGVPLADTHHLMAHALQLQDRGEQALAEAAKAAPGHRAYAARIRGRIHMAAKDVAAAALAFNDAIAAAPDDAEVWTDVARFRRSTGELGQAVGAADKAVALNPKSVEALTLRAEVTRSQYGLAASIPWFDRALEIDPDNVIALAERAATLGDLGRMKAMLADTRKILSLNAKNPMAFYLQAMLAARARKYDLARSLYQKTNGALDDEPAGMLLAAAIEYETGNPSQAIARLGRLVAMQPDNHKARRLLAAAQWRRGDAAATIETLRPVADRADADAYVLTLFGRALERQGDKAAAAVYLARAAQPAARNPAALLSQPVDDTKLAAMRREADARPNDATLQVPLIRALLARGVGGEALQRARQLQARNPGAPDAHLLVGDALGIHGNFAAAAEEYRKAANITFTETVAMRLVEALRNAGNSGGAAKVLELFLQQNPQNVPAQLLAANNYLQSGRWDGAIAIYERLRLRIGDRDATVLNNLAWAYAETGNFERAVPLARRAWALDKRNPATADTLGWILFKSGENKAEGLALLQQAARGAPTDADIRKHLEAAKSG
jgi:tetratricopeptide (TPR) repeat protein